MNVYPQRLSGSVEVTAATASREKSIEWRLGNSQLCGCCVLYSMRIVSSQRQSRILPGHRGIAGSHLLGDGRP